MKNIELKVGQIYQFKGSLHNKLEVEKLVNDEVFWVGYKNPEKIKNASQNLKANWKLIYNPRTKSSKTKKFIIWPEGFHKLEKEGKSIKDILNQVEEEGIYYIQEYKPQKFQVSVLSKKVIKEI